MILEGLRNFRGGVWTPQTPPRYATAVQYIVWFRINRPSNLITAGNLIQYDRLFWNRSPYRCQSPHISNEQIQRSRLTSVDEDSTSDYKLPPRVKTDLCRRRYYVRLQASSKGQDWPLSTKTVRQITSFLQGSRLSTLCNFTVSWFIVKSWWWPNRVETCCHSNYNELVVCDGKYYY